MFCEVGAWRDYDELESSLTLDELFLTYEMVAERQQRLMKTIAAAWGASEDEHTSGAAPPGTFVDDKGNVAQLFAYQQVDKIE